MIEPLAEMVRRQPHILGFRFRGESHVIKLFADDAVFLLTDPARSLPQVLNILNAFSAISYYKVNYSKSLILDLGVPHAAKTKLQEDMPFSWAQNGIPCLGITLPASVLAKANYELLILSINSQLRNLAKTELSWVGRLAADKMSVLPQVLYYFRVLPIPLLLRFIKLLTKSLHGFLWQQKKPCCARKYLILHKSVGGMGLFETITDRRQSSTNSDIGSTLIVALAGQISTLRRQML